MNYRREIMVALVVIFAGIYIHGWRSIDYIRDDQEIGKKVHFIRQMLCLSNLPKEVMGGAISRRYSSILWEYRRWSTSLSRSPEIDEEEVSCNDVFTVDSAFYVPAHGILESLFSAGRNKYYVLSSKKCGDTVVTEIDYQAYARYANPDAVDIQCGATLD